MSETFDRRGHPAEAQKVVDATQRWFWGSAWQSGEAEASADVDAGRVTHFTNDEDFLASLDD